MFRTQNGMPGWQVARPRVPILHGGGSLAAMEVTFSGDSGCAGTL